MNYYENKQLQDRESHIIASGVVFLIFAVVIALILAAVIAYPLGLPFNPMFYGLWAFFEIAGVCGIVGGIKEKIDRKKNISN